MNQLVEERACPPFTRKTFKQLAQYRDIKCISIFFTFKNEEQVINFESSLNEHFEHIAKELENKGVDHHIVRDNINEIRIVLKELSQNEIIGKGLAIFIGDKLTFINITSTPFEFYVYINDHFYLRPLAPLIDSNCNLMVLSLNNQEGRIFHVTNHEIRWLATIRNNIYDPGKNGQNNITEFIRESSRRLKNFINGHANKPVLLASPYSIMKVVNQVNENDVPYDFFVDHNPSLEDNLDLQKKIVDHCIMQSIRMKEENLREFAENENSSASSSDLSEIIKASFKGKVKVLFIDKDHDVFGEYDEHNNYLFIDTDHSYSNTSLTNIAAIHTVLNNGNVYFVDHTNFSNNGSPVKALLAND